MNCNDASAILDAHRYERLSPAERCAVDEHLTGCDNCTAAWHAHAAMVGLSVPPVSATLLERVMLAARVPQPAPRRRLPLARVAVGAAVLAGVAFAGVTVMSLTRSPPATVPSATSGEPSTQPTERVVEPESPAGSTAARVMTADLPTSVDLVETPLSIQPIARTPPDYPPGALKDGVEGYVQLEFDVTAFGTVENVRIVESSAELFEEPAVRAISTWRYLPRISGGKRAPSLDVQTIIRFALSREPAAVTLQRLPQNFDYASFTADIRAAADRLAVDDLRGAELQLDEMQAIYGRDRADLWNFYGYLYTVQGNYGLAIDAYESSARISLASRFPSAGPWASLANLYFARHQYDRALETLLRPQRAAGTAPYRRMAEETVLIEKLRALGVTEETLVGR